MYKYETHLHTFPVSLCSKAEVEENLLFYKSLGYDGVFITNHFLDGNINTDRSAPYREQIAFYFSDYEKALVLSETIGIRVFFGVEMSYEGIDFLVYGLDKAWFLAHPEIMHMKKSQELSLMMECGALVIQAHPFRESGYIDHIQLFPRYIHGVEVVNANRTPFENAMAKQFAENYGLLPFGGTDNHRGKHQTALAGMQAKTPIRDEADFVRQVLGGNMELFTLQL